MFCQNCGKSLLENAKFCPECGTKVILETSESTSEPINVENDTVENKIILNGMSFDFEDIKRIYGNQKIEAIKHLYKASNSTLREAKEAFDIAYAKDENNNKNSNSAEEGKANFIRKQEEKERLNQMDREGILYCPKCHSTSISANKKGFGIGKAVVGAAMTGGLGLMAGNIGAKKIRVTCLNCGKSWMAGKK